MLRKCPLILACMFQQLTIHRSAKVAFSHNKNPPPGSDKKETKVDLDFKFNKLKKDLAAENEVSVSVTWTGGGQHIKARKLFLQQIPCISRRTSD
jgi:hypothetical protein